jgi:hypothetical protein
MSTPIQRLTRLLNEGARFMVELPGHDAIDLTPDVIAAMAQAQTKRDGFEPGKESIEPAASGGDVPTLVEFTCKIIFAFPT